MPGGREGGILCCVNIWKKSDSEVKLDLSFVFNPLYEVISLSTSALRRFAASNLANTTIFRCYSSTLIIPFNTLVIEVWKLNFSSAIMSR